VSQIEICTLVDMSFGLDYEDTIWCLSDAISALQRLGTVFAKSDLSPLTLDFDALKNLGCCQMMYDLGGTEVLIWLSPLVYGLTGVRPLITESEKTEVRFYTAQRDGIGRWCKEYLIMTLNDITEVEAEEDWWWNGTPVSYSLEQVYSLMGNSKSQSMDVVLKKEQDLLCVGPHTKILDIPHLSAANTDEVESVSIRTAIISDAMATLSASEEDFKVNYHLDGVPRVRSERMNRYKDIHKWLWITRSYSDHVVVVRKRWSRYQADKKRFLDHIYARDVSFIRHYIGQLKVSGTQITDELLSFKSITDMYSNHSSSLPSKIRVIRRLLVKPILTTEQRWNGLRSRTRARELKRLTFEGSGYNWFEIFEMSKYSNYNLQYNIFLESLKELTVTVNELRYISGFLPYLDRLGYMRPQVRYKDWYWVVSYRIDSHISLADINNNIMLTLLCHNDESSIMSLLPIEILSWICTLTMLQSRVTTRGRDLIS